MTDAPAQLDAERHLLGSVLRDNSAMEEIAPLVDVDDFHAAAHRKVYGAMRRLWLDNEPIDLLTVPDALGTHELGAIGGIRFIASLFESVPVATDLPYYATILRDKSIRRRLIAACTDIVSQAHDTQIDAADVLQAANRAVGEIENATLTKGPVDVRTLIEGTLRRFDDVTKNRAKVGIATHYEKYDDWTGGLHPGDLVVVAGRPGMGKTSFAMNIAENVSIHGTPTLFFSLEMGEDQLADRLILGGAGVRVDSIRTGHIRESDRNVIMDRVNAIYKSSLYVDDKAGVTVDYIQMTARKLDRRLRMDGSGLGLILIDYLQIMSIAKRGERRDLEIAEITRRLKMLAKDMGVPIILLAQLNRKAEDRPKKRPQLADLKESGAIEQDADVVLFLVRPWVYDEKEDPNLAEAIVAKNRHGATGVIELRFVGEFSRFENRKGGLYDI